MLRNSYCAASSAAFLALRCESLPTSLSRKRLELLAAVLPSMQQDVLTDSIEE